jgi:aspartate/methionine/tyrosine aminotransferase
MHLYYTGHFVFPPELKDVVAAMSIIASETHSCVSAPIQYACLTAYQTPRLPGEYV